MSSTAVTEALAVLELRQYTLHPGRRDTLIALFEREFVEPQEDVGARIVGTFRDLDNPDRFVWLRGFADMAARADALTAFYGGPAWQANRETANATMVDSDNVLLLRPLGGDQGLRAALQPRPPVGAAPTARGVFTITVCPLLKPADDALVHAFDQCVHPWWVGVGGDLLACWVTEPAPNNFPRLPVRENEPVIAWLTRFDDEAAQQRHATLLRSSGCLERAEWRAHLSGEPQQLRLAPTPRSALRRRHSIEG
ncbi:NIPSNAP family protein [Scleromatobacter humisilvae]|uniref:NIPSNAP family protein n=1 Tax=Scleromatobacter humisilvae TaxID=2897159 RepID=A0A9X1YHV7_9BURK|nr:NIPSNAP family protein [Scleromatobacter humisilvae]MCK9685180.1 NIPSNAP family protein [Scleromatobacter humisilvae]